MSSAQSSVASADAREEERSSLENVSTVSPAVPTLENCCGLADGALPDGERESHPSRASQLTIDAAGDHVGSAERAKGTKYKLSVSASTSRSLPYSEWDVSRTAEWLKALSLFDLIPEQ